MTRYRISIARSALRALSELDKPVRRRLQSAIDGLADEPRPRGTRALVDRPGLLRMRVGDYRVVYQVRDGELLVLVVDLGHRGEIYRQRRRAHRDHQRCPRDGLGVRSMVAEPRYSKAERTAPSPHPAG